MTATAISLRKARSTNSTATTWASKVPTATKPTGDGVVNLYDGNLGLAREGLVPKFMQLVPYLTDANNESMGVRVYGWSRTTGVGSTTLWIPQLLVDLVVTAGNIAAGTEIGANHFIADTITLNKGDSQASIISPANDTPASCLFHMRGCEIIEFDFNVDTSLTDGAAANCFWRVMDQC